MSRPGSSPKARLPRLLALVPYLQAHPGVEIAHAAADFGVTDEQLRSDLELLWMCGLPGHGPGDLIDLSFEGDSVTVTFDAGIRRPLRLSADEALSLQVALQTLAEVPGLTGRDVVERTLAKIEAAAGHQDPQAAGVAVAPDRDGRRPGTDERLATLRGALEDGRAVHLTYYVAGRDETTERIVDPMQLLLVEGRTYLEAWSRSSGQTRMFRVDRIDAAVVLDEPARVPAGVRPRDVADGVFTPSAEHTAVTLRLGPRARWVADYYPCEEVRDDGPDLVVVLRVADEGWARRLVLGLGESASLLGPPELIRAIRDEAERTLARYTVTAGAVGSPS